MLQYTFIQKNSSIIIIIKANSFEEAEKLLFETIIDNYGWRVDDEEGEEIE